jgi:hypothetical protein
MGFQYVNSQRLVLDLLSVNSINGGRANLFRILSRISRHARSCPRLYDSKWNWSEKSSSKSLITQEFIHEYLYILWKFQAFEFMHLHADAFSLMITSSLSASAPHFSKSNVYGYLAVRYFARIAVMAQAKQNAEVVARPITYLGASFAGHK